MEELNMNNFIRYTQKLKALTLQRHVQAYLYQLAHILTFVKQTLDLLAVVVKAITFSIKELPLTPVWLQ